MFYKDRGLVKETFRDTEFTLTIDMGNDAMCSREDVAQALRDVADSILRSDANALAIRDGNGNRVGTYMFEQEQCDPDAK